MVSEDSHVSLENYRIEIPGTGGEIQEMEEIDVQRDR